MEFQKIVNLRDTTYDDKDLPRFVIKKWIEVYEQSGKKNVTKEIRIQTPILRSNLCDFSDAYVVLKRDIAVAVTESDNARGNNASFMNCIAKINGLQIDNAEDLDVISAMYNLLEYSKIYEKQQTVCGIITETNQVILFLLILNLLNTTQVLQKTLMMLVLVKLVMMKTEMIKIKIKLLFS